jgi:hypothetical protein
MCEAFSCIATGSKVYWKAGLDSYRQIKEKFKLKDLDAVSLVPIEITPDEGYLHPEGRWTLQFDNTSKIAPDWWKQSHEQRCYAALEKWKKEIYTGFNYKEALNPIHPFKLPAVKKVTKKQIKLLVEWGSVWASVRGSVGDSVWGSVWASVRGSVGDSVWTSVWDSVWSSVGVSVRDSVGFSVGDSVWVSVGFSVRDSVRASVWGYISSLFPKIEFKFNFSSNTKLWKMGLVPSFDGTTWRLHTGKDAHVVYEISAEELRKMRRSGEDD